MSSAVYITTRGRIPYLLKCARSLWVLLKDTDTPVHLVTEKEEMPAIKEAIPTWAKYFPVPRSDGGIGDIRYRIINHAATMGYETMAIIDDDQVIKGDITGLLDVARREDVTGVGAYVSYMGLALGGTNLVRAARAKEVGTWLHSGSIGYQCFALNVQNVLRCGNFPRIPWMEDTELCRQSYKELAQPWFVYTGCQTVNGITVPNAPVVGGGCYWPDWPDRKLRAHAYCYERWPKYMSAPPGRIRCSWKRLAADFLNVDYWPLENVRTDEAWDWEN